MKIHRNDWTALNERVEELSGRLARQNVRLNQEEDNTLEATRRRADLSSRIERLAEALERESTGADDLDARLSDVEKLLNVRTKDGGLRAQSIVDLADRVNELEASALHNSAVSEANVRLGKRAERLEADVKMMAKQRDDAREELAEARYHHRRLADQNAGLIRRIEDGGKPQFAQVLARMLHWECFGSSRRFSGHEKEWVGFAEWCLKSRGLHGGGPKERREMLLPRLEKLQVLRQGATWSEDMDNRLMDRVARLAVRMMNAAEAK